MGGTSGDDDSLRTVSSALATLSLAQSFMLDELYRLSPEAAKRVAESLDGYVKHVTQRHGEGSVDAATTKVTVDMITSRLKGEQVGE